MAIGDEELGPGVRTIAAPVTAPTARSSLRSGSPSQPMSTRRRAAQGAGPRADRRHKAHLRRVAFSLCVARGRRPWRFTRLRHWLTGRAPTVPRCAGSPEVELGAEDERNPHHRWRAVSVLRLGVDVAIWRCWQRPLVDGMCRAQRSETRLWPARRRVRRPARRSVAAPRPRSPWQGAVDDHRPQLPIELAAQALAQLQRLGDAHLRGVCHRQVGGAAGSSSNSRTWPACRATGPTRAIVPNVCGERSIASAWPVAGASKTIKSSSRSPPPLAAALPLRSPAAVDSPPPPSPLPFRGSCSPRSVPGHRAAGPGRAPIASPSWSSRARRGRRDQVLEARARGEHARRYPPPDRSQPFAEHTVAVDRKAPQPLS